MTEENHDIKWYIERIGKRVFRTEAFCKCV